MEHSVCIVRGMLLTVDARLRHQQVGPDGAIERALADTRGVIVSEVTSAVEADGRLFLGSLSRPGIAVLDLSPAST
jgi:hypothetical protein